MVPPFADLHLTRSLLYPIALEKLVPEDTEKLGDGHLGDKGGDPGDIKQS